MLMARRVQRWESSKRLQHIHTHTTQTDRQTDRQTDGRTDRQTGRERERKRESDTDEDKQIKTPETHVR